MQTSKQDTEKQTIGDIIYNILTCFYKDHFLKEKYISKNCIIEFGKIKHYRIQNNLFERQFKR